MKTAHNVTWAGLLGLITAGVAVAGPLQSETFVETAGWQARFVIACYEPGAQCGSFEFRATGCRGELHYLGEADEGFQFREKLQEGRCTPQCVLWLSADMDRYREICRGSEAGAGRLQAERKAPPGPTRSGTPSAGQAPGAGKPAAAAPSVPPAAPLPLARQVAGNAGQSAQQSAAGSAPRGVTESGAGKAAELAADPVPLPVRPLAAAANAPRLRSGTTTYIGEFRVDPVSGQVSGQGWVEWQDGKRYHGPVVEGRLNGVGWMEANGDVYQGEMRDGAPQGQGVYVWARGDRYRGSWQAGQKHGPGRYQYPDGSYWDGEYRDDAQQEGGKLHWQARAPALLTVAPAIPAAPASSASSASSLDSRQAATAPAVAAVADTSAAAAALSVSGTQAEVVAAADCPTALALRSLPDGSVSDPATGLVWQACLLGQLRRDGVCQGRARELDWGNAVLAAAADRFAGRQDWRLPTRAELQALSLPGCLAETGAPALLPGRDEAQSLWLWTLERPAANADEQAFAFGLSSDNGAMQMELESRFAVWLVRGGAAQADFAAALADVAD